MSLLVAGVSSYVIGLLLILLQFSTARDTGRKNVDMGPCKNRGVFASIHGCTWLVGTGMTLHLVS